MKKYKIIMENVNSKKLKNKFVSKFSFAEAASAAYMTRSQLGFDWKINQVSEIKNPVDDNNAMGD